jgi:hypothetical protein
MSRYNYSSSGAGLGVGCVMMSAILGFYFGIVYLISFWTDRNLDFWFSYFKGVPADVPQWLSFVATLFTPITIPANIIMELARFAI